MNLAIIMDKLMEMDEAKRELYRESVKTNIKFLRILYKDNRLTKLDLFQISHYNVYYMIILFF